MVIIKLINYRFIEYKKLKSKIHIKIFKNLIGILMVNCDLNTIFIMLKIKSKIVVISKFFIILLIIL